MTSIERTAYPYLCANKSISQKTLDTCYTLNQEEHAYIEKHIRGNRLKFNFAIQLKTFQHLGYFISINDVPPLILDYIKSQISDRH